MNESVCSKVSEVERAQSFDAKTRGPKGGPASACKQLMCSLDAAEVEALKATLGKAGIATETRSNAQAEALGVTAIELWIKNEKDFAEAANLYAVMQVRSRGRASGPSAARNSDATHARTAGVQPRTEPCKGPAPSATENRSTQADERAAEALEKSASLLEKQIEDMLRFQRELGSQSASALGRMRELREALDQREATVDLESQRRAAAQKKLAEEISSLQRALDSERLDRARIEQQLEEERAERRKAEEQLSRAKDEWLQQCHAQQEPLKKAQDKLDLQARLLQTHGAAVQKLTKDVATLQFQRDNAEKSLSNLRLELAAERNARLAAEQRAEAAEAQKSLRLPLLLFRRPGNTKGEPGTASATSA